MILVGCDEIEYLGILKFWELDLTRCDHKREKDRNNGYLSEYHVFMDMTYLVVFDVPAYLKGLQFRVSCW